VQVLIGGFHVSGCLAMLNETPSDIKAAQELGISIYAGEAEEGLDEVILDAKRSELRPIYDHMKHLPDIGEMPRRPSCRRFRQAHNRQCHEFRCRPRLPLPVLVLHHHQRAGPQVTLSLPDSVEQILRMNYDQGVNRFFITDDNFARNKDWEAIYDRIIKLREVDEWTFASAFRLTRSAIRSRTSLTSPRRAGVTRVFIGSRASIPPI
jgi:hypothetical protein